MTEEARDDTQWAQPGPLGPKGAMLAFAALPCFAWTLHLGIVYAGVYPAARARDSTALWVVSAACLVLCAIGAALSGFRLRGVRELPSDAAFIGRAGVALGVFFALVVMAQTLPIALLDPRQ